MRPTATIISIPVLILLCACSHNPESRDNMTEHLPCSEIVQSDMQPTQTPDCDLDDTMDTKLFDDSIRWHREMLDHGALHRVINP